jgi:hypothetical protein
MPALGNGDKAYHFFKDAYEPNLNPPFRVIAETKGGTNPIFCNRRRRYYPKPADGFWWFGYYPNRHHTNKKQAAIQLEIIKNYRGWC